MIASTAQDKQLSSAPATINDDHATTNNYSYNDKPPSGQIDPQWVLVAVGSITAAFIAWQSYETRRAAGAANTGATIAEKTLILTQRPRIAARMFYFSKVTGVGGIYYVPNEIEAGSFCNGQFYILNVGGTSATIKEIVCQIYIQDGAGLPMKRPYEGQTGIQEPKPLGPGQSVPFLFGRMEPLDAQTWAEIAEFKTKNFYVLGWVGYTDDLGIYRITYFCRRYDPISKRFVAVDDSDYEYED